LQRNKAIDAGPGAVLPWASAVTTTG